MLADNSDARAEQRDAEGAGAPTLSFDRRHDTPAADCQPNRPFLRNRAAAAVLPRATRPSRNGRNASREALRHHVTRGAQGTRHTGFGGVFLPYLLPLGRRRAVAVHVAQRGRVVVHGASWGWSW
jgi:hypothetical protein